jgi:hypothetical protein
MPHMVFEMVMNDVSCLELRGLYYNVGIGAWYAMFVNSNDQLG